MADRWVSTPHVFPNCCHRCLRSGEEHGPYFHEEWNYCQPDRWPGVTPESPRIARKFTCRKCLQSALNADGAPVFDEAKVTELENKVEDLQNELELASASLHRPIEVVDVGAVLALMDAQKAAKKPATRKKATA